MMLGLIKAWLEMPVMEEDGERGTRRTNPCVVETEVKLKWREYREILAI